MNSETPNNPYKKLLGQDIPDVEAEEMANALTDFFQVLMEIDKENKNNSK